MRCASSLDTVTIEVASVWRRMRRAGQLVDTAATRGRTVARQHRWRRQSPTIVARSCIRGVPLATVRKKRWSARRRRRGCRSQLCHEWHAASSTYGRPLGFSDGQHIFRINRIATGYRSQPVPRAHTTAFYSHTCLLAHRNIGCRDRPDYCETENDSATWYYAGCPSIVAKQMLSIRQSERRAPRSLLACCVYRRSYHSCRQQCCSR